MILINPEYIGSIIETPKNINFSISQEGNNYFHISSDIDFDILSIETKALTNIATNGELIIENDAFKFTTKILKKEFVESTKKYDYRLNVILVDSAPVSCDSTRLRIGFIVKYSVGGFEKNINIYNTPYNFSINTEKKPIYYYSKLFSERKYYPYSLMVDSIYRPFFFNALFLLIPDNLTKEITNEQNSSGLFFYSIANGCTYRKNVETSHYFIGDLSLEISNIDEYENFKEDYNLTIGNHYRDFSEIVDVPKEGELREKHINGIRESGENNKRKVFNLGSIGDISIGELRGIFLKKNTNGKKIFIKENDNMLNIEHVVSDLNGTNINLYDENDVFKIEYGKNKLINISFNVNDGSPDNKNYTTIGKTCEKVFFPDLTYTTNGNKIYITENENYNNDKYLYVETSNPLHIQYVLDIFNNINVNDNETIFDNLKKIEGLEVKKGVKTENKNYSINCDSGNSNKFVFCFYIDGFVDSEQNVIKDTSKILLCKIYKVF